MKINQTSNTMYINQNLNKAKQEKEDANEKMSSGSKINRAKDDPAGLSLSIELAMNQQDAHSQIRHAQDGISMAQIAEATMHETTSMMLDMRDIALQAANGSYGLEQRKMLDSEFSALQSEISRQWHQTSTSPSHMLDSGRLTGVFSHDKQAQEFTEHVQDAMRDLPAQDVLTQEHANQSIGVIDQALTDISMAQAKLGASQNALEHRMHAQELTEIHLAESKSRIQDTDFAESLMASAISSAKTDIGVMLRVQANAKKSDVMHLLK